LFKVSGEVALGSSLRGDSTKPMVGVGLFFTVDSLHSGGLEGQELLNETALFPVSSTLERREEMSSMELPKTFGESLLVRS